MLGKKKTQDRLNELLDFVQADLSKLSPGVKRKLAKKFEYIHTTNLVYSEKGKPSPSKRIKLTISLLPEIQQILKSFVEEIIEYHDGPIDLPSFKIQLWTLKNGSFKFAPHSLPVNKEDSIEIRNWKKKQNTEFYPDLPLVISEFIMHLGTYPGTVIRRCAYPKCGHIFASVSAKEKFYHTTTCFYRHYNQVKREAEKLFKKEIPKEILKETEKLVKEELSKRLLKKKPVSEAT